MSKAKSAPTVKVVGSGDSIEVQIDDDVLDRLSEMYPDDEEELVRWALDVGVGELVGRYEMLEEESRAVRDDDGVHRVNPSPSFDDEEGEE